MNEGKNYEESDVVTDIRYVMDHSGGRSNSFYSLKEVEEGLLRKNIEMVEDAQYKIFRRDLSSRRTDSEGNLVFENDLVEFVTRRGRRGRGKVKLENGVFWAGRIGFNDIKEMRVLEDGA